MKYSMAILTAALWAVTLLPMRQAQAAMNSESFKKVTDQIEVEVARFRDLATIKNQMPEKDRKRLMMSALNRGLEIVDDLNPDLNPFEIKSLSSAHLALSQASHLVEVRNDYVAASKILDRWFLDFQHTR